MNQQELLDAARRYRDDRRSWHEFWQAHGDAVRAMGLDRDRERDLRQRLMGVVLLDLDG
jgi:hypothetical protein